jgi:hypothetical protein
MLTFFLREFGRVARTLVRKEGDVKTNQYIARKTVNSAVSLVASPFAGTVADIMFGYLIDEKINKLNNNELNKKYSRQSIISALNYLIDENILDKICCDFIIVVYESNNKIDEIIFDKGIVKDICSKITEHGINYGFDKYLNNQKSKSNKPHVIQNPQIPNNNFTTIIIIYLAHNQGILRVGEGKWIYKNYRLSKCIDKQFL